MVKNTFKKVDDNELEFSRNKDVDHKEKLL